MLMRSRQIQDEEEIGSREFARLVLAELRDISARLERIERAAKSVSPDAALLAAISREVGAASFSAADLIRAAQKPHRVALAEAIHAAVGQLNARRLGRRVARFQGRESWGFVVEHQGKDRAGAIWRIRRIGDSRGSKSRPA